MTWKKSINTTIAQSQKSKYTDIKTQFLTYIWISWNAITTDTILTTTYNGQHNIRISYIQLRDGTNYNANLQIKNNIGSEYQNG